MAKEPEIGSPEWQRADYNRALKEELDAAKASSKSPERIKAIEAEIKRHSSQPRHRRDAKKDEA